MPIIDPEIHKYLSSISNEPWTISPFTEGNTNTVYLVYTHKLKYVLRVFGSEGLIDRSNEFLNIKVLSQLGYAPKIINLFKTAMITEFIPGQVLKTYEMKNEIANITKKIKQWRLIKPDDIHIIGLEHPYLDTKEAINNFLSQKPLLIITLEKWYKMVFEKQINLSIINEIKEKIEQIKIDTANCKVSFCHNDLLSGNILKVKNGEVFFIDYEYAGFNYQSFEIANHFAEYAGYELDFEKIPKFKQIKKLLPEFTEDEIYEIMYFIPISHLFWGLWALLREGEFDYFAYGKKRIEVFMRDYKRLNKTRAYYNKKNKNHHI